MAATRKRTAAPKWANVSDDAVRKATGRAWDDWFALLDGQGAAALDHKGIVACLYPKHLEDGWWCQMITVGYEQARGLRKKHEKPGGFEISASKTVGAPLADLFAAWETKAARRWLGEHAGFTVRKATATKSMRITWTDGASSVSVNFYAAGADRSKVQLNHGKLKSAAECERWKAWWKDALERLARTVERR